MYFVVSADMQTCRLSADSLQTLCRLVMVPYIFHLIYVVFVSFSLWSEFLKPNTYYLTFIDLFEQCENSVLAREHDELQWYGVQKSWQSQYVTACEPA